MRIYIAIFSILVLNFLTGFGQTSYEYTMAIYNKVSAFNRKMSNDTFLVRRIETGVLSQENNTQSGASSRRLFSGKEYIIVAFTDARVNDFSLTLFKENSDKQWEPMDSKAEDVNISRNADELIGGVKIVSVKPLEDGAYRFKVSAAVQNNVLGRYAIMIWSKDDDSLSRQPVTYSIDNYSTSNYDTAAQKYGEFSAATAYSCQFIIDANETTITQKEPAGGIAVFRILKKDDTDARWTEYDIQGAKGTKFEFLVPKNGKPFIRVTVSGGGNPLTDYHIAGR